MKKFATAFLLLFSIIAFSQDTIPASKAKEHINQLVCVTGKVASFKKASPEKTTNYINLEAPFPDAIFTIVITNEYLETKKIKIEELQNKTIFVYGKVTTYKNDPKQVPQIFNPRWIEIKKH